METAMDTLRRIMNISPLAQMLFSKQTLEIASPEARRILPGIQPGMTDEEIFGTAVVDFRRFQGSGSILFPADLAGFSCDVTVTDWDGASLATITPTFQTQNAATMLSVAEQVRRPMAAVMAVTPKLLPELEKLQSRGLMDRASELNKGLYSILRLTRNVELYAGGRMVLHRNLVELGAWLQRLVEELEPLFQEADRSLVFQQPEGCCVCSLDEQHMQQALLNLVSNAIKFSRPGGTITLSCQRSGSQVWIAVRDQGMGIPADQMGLVFHRSEHRGMLPDPLWGAGLGLPVARNIVEAHGGRLLLESRENVGTSVYIALEAGPDQCMLRSPVKLPVDCGGIDPVLVGLADVLPASVFDTRGVDL